MLDSDTPSTGDNAALVERLTLALQAAEVGTWDYNLETGFAEWSPICKQLFGLAPDAPVNASILLDQVHPEDREWVNLANRKALSPDTTGEHNITFRIRSDNGQHRWLQAKGRIYRNEIGQLIRFAGIVMDVTASIETRQQLQTSQALFRSLIEEAPVATCLFVGRSLTIEVANDLMINFWGKDRSVLGRPLREAVPELVGQPFLQILDDIFSSGQLYEAEDAPAELPVNGVPGTYYFDFTYKPLLNTQGDVYAVLEMAVDVTERVLAQQKIEAVQQQVLAAFEQAPVAIAIINEANLTFQMANPFYAELVGRKVEDLVGKPLLEAMPELTGQGFDQLLKKVIATDVAYVAKEVAVDLVRQDRLETIYVDLTYQPRKEAGSKRVSGVLVVATDVTQQVLSRKEIEASEVRLRSVIASAPAAMGLFVGRELIIELPNQAFIDIVGKGPDIAGKPLQEVMPELANQPFLQILDEVFTSGKKFQSFDTQADIVQHGIMTHNYYNITFTPLFDTQGQVYAILDISIDVTDAIKARQKVEEAESTLRGAIELAQLGTWEADVVTRKITYSDRLKAWFGFTVDELEPEAVYVPIHDADRARVRAAMLAALLPGTDGIFDEEYRLVDQLTGVERIIHSQGKTYFDAQGQPLKISGTAQDVTAQRQLQLALEQQVRERTQELAQANYNLQSIMDSAPIAIMFFSPIWQGDQITDFLWVNLNKTAEMLNGRSADQILGETMSAFMPLSKDMALFDRYVEVIRTGVAFHVEQEYQVYSNRVWFDITAVRREGGLTLTALDISERKQAELKVETSILELQRSNANLEQFAYVASHDLQEPLRKIQSFGDILKTQYTDQLGEGVAHLERMQLAASRMSTLIKDLLTFSRISTRQETLSSVALEQIVRTILNDLELIVQETGAVVELATLPTVQGDRSQLEQLFQNLLNNAFKFRRVGVTPIIRISSRDIAETDLPPSVKPVRSTPFYHQIDVADNGIGFDEKYLNRIFQVFQRLHGRNEFAGTGIGLAICEKVVTNHGGAITATSQPGQGATFSVYLPA
jgi:PAS domain S-box-containing protein